VRNRKQGFTLIELLVVITILMMLMTLLLPAIFKARTWVTGMMVKGRITGLRNSCDSYFQIFNAYPGVVSELTNTRGTPSKLTGTQNLVLSLFGCSRNNNVYAFEVRGPAADIEQYTSPGVRKYEPFFNPKPGELVTQDILADVNTKYSGYDSSFRILVDYLLSPPRAILYYRQYPRYEQDKGSDGKLKPFKFADNQLYCLDDKAEDATAFDKALKAVEKSTPGFLLISAGPNRVYDFGPDDFSNAPW
jgi:prepilin-type N-terminal cleavage/methylation domain-containing protein